MLGAVVRFIVSALVLMVVAWLVPGMRLAGFWTALWAAIAIAAIGWLVERVFGRGVSPQARGFVGFLVAAAVIYLTQFLIAGISVSIFGALLAAFVIGLIDAVVPTALR